MDSEYDLANLTVNELRKIAKKYKVYDTSRKDGLITSIKEAMRRSKRNKYLDECLKQNSDVIKAKSNVLRLNTDGKNDYAMCKDQAWLAGHDDDDYTVANDDECDNWIRNKTVDPVTLRSISPNGHVYKNYEKKCLPATMTPEEEKSALNPAFDLDDRNYLNDLIAYFFKLFNQRVFDVKLTGRVLFKWYNDDDKDDYVGFNTYIPSSAQSYRCNVMIMLSKKHVRDISTLRNAIAHQLCHAASHIIDGYMSDDHGENWYKWFYAFRTRFPTIEISNECTTIRPNQQQSQQQLVPIMQYTIINDTNREYYLKHLFALFDKNYFSNELTGQVQIAWYTDPSKSRTGITRITNFIQIWLCQEYIDDSDKLIDALIHHMCHAYVYKNSISESLHGENWTEFVESIEQKGGLGMTISRTCELQQPPQQQYIQIPLNETAVPVDNYNRGVMIAHFIGLYDKEVFNKQLALRVDVHMFEDTGDLIGTTEYDDVSMKIRIWLSTKFTANSKLLRDALSHQLCHAAVYIIDHDTINWKEHGEKWDKWAKLCDRYHFDWRLDPITRVCRVDRPTTQQDVTNNTNAPGNFLTDFDLATPRPVPLPEPETEPVIAPSSRPVPVPRSRPVPAAALPEPETEPETESEPVIAPSSRPVPVPRSRPVPAAALPEPETEPETEPVIAPSSRPVPVPRSRPVPAAALPEPLPHVSDELDFSTDSSDSLQPGQPDRVNYDVTDSSDDTNDTLAWLMDDKDANWSINPDGDDIPIQQTEQPNRQSASAPATFNPVPTTKFDVPLWEDIFGRNARPLSPRVYFMDITGRTVDLGFYLGFCIENRLNPANTVFVFPGNPTHHLSHTAFSIKTGRGLARLAYDITNAGYPALSLPTKDIDGHPNLPNEAIGDLWKAIGYGLCLVVPVRKQVDTEYFTSSITINNQKYEPSFWGNTVNQSNKQVADMYLAEILKMNEMIINDDFETDYNYGMNWILYDDDFFKPRPLEAAHPHEQRVYFMNITDTTVNASIFELFCEGQRLDPTKTVYVFFHSGNYHASHSLFSIKAGNGNAAKAAYYITKSGYPALSLPIQVGEKDKMSAIGDIWKAIGYGFKVVLPVRIHKDNKYFSDSIKIYNVDYEPAFWEDESYKESYKGVGDWYLAQIKLMNDVDVVNEFRREFEMGKKAKTINDEWFKSLTESRRLENLSKSMNLSFDATPNKPRVHYMYEENITVASYNYFCTSINLDPKKTVFVFPGKYKRTDILYSLKKGDIPNDVSSIISQAGIATLTLPYERTKYHTASEVAHTAIGYIWKAIGYGLDIVIPVIEKDNGSMINFSENIQHNNLHDYYVTQLQTMNKVVMDGSFADEYLIGLNAKLQTTPVPWFRFDPPVAHYTRSKAQNQG